MNIDLTSVFAQLGMLFCFMAVGYLCKKIKLTDNAFDKALSRFVLNVTLPAMIVASELSSEELPSAQTMGTTILCACALYALMIVLAEVVVRVMRVGQGRRGVYRFMCVFGNVGFIGFPVVSAVFGSQAVIYAAVFNIPFNLLVFTLGALWLTSDAPKGDDALDKGKVRVTPRLFFNPCLISCYAIIVLSLAGVHQVPFATGFFDTLGGVTVPAALVIIGSNLANMPVKDLLGDVRLYLMTLTRLIVMPLAAWVVLRLFVFDPQLLGIAVIIAGMPVATNGTMLCFQYGGDMRTMSQGTFISTLLAFVGIPLLAMFLVTVGG